jgi:hypothetical protein
MLLFKTFSHRKDIIIGQTDIKKQHYSKQNFHNEKYCWLNLITGHVSVKLFLEMTGSDHNGSNDTGVKYILYHFQGPIV